MSAVPRGAYGRKRRLETPPDERKNKKRKTEQMRKADQSNKKNRIDRSSEEDQTHTAGVPHTQKQVPTEKVEFSSTEESLRVVGEFHTLNKRIEQTKNDKYLSDSDKNEKIKEFEQQIEDMGGLEKYQRASMFGASTNQNAAFNSSKWVLQELRTRGYANSSGDKEFRIKRILDVGAINNQYLHCSDWLEIIPIDLNPQHPSVLKADFFEYAKQYIKGGTNGVFDSIILSLVVNFVGDIQQRGEMIALCAHPHFLRTGGLLFVVLPSACIQNSRYMKYSRFVALFESLGFSLVSHKLSKKLVFWIFQLTTPTSHYNTSSDSFHFITEFPRKLVRGGSKCNNFTILLKNKSEN